MLFGEWRELAPSLARAVLVVVLGVGVEDASGMSLVADQQVVERFAAEGSDDPFAVGVHPWSPWRGLHGLDAVGGEDRVEGPGVFGVPITDQEAQRVNTGAQLGGQVPGLLHGPGCRRVRGDPGDAQSACAVFEEHQRIYPTQVDQVDVDEVAGNQALGLLGEELAPGWSAAAWGRIETGRREDLPNRRGADAMPQPHEFALDAAAAPARFSLASRSATALTALAVGGLPGRRRRTR